MLRKDHPWWRWRNERSMIFLASVCVQAYKNNIVYGLWRVMIFVTLVTKKYHPLNPSIILHKKHITNISTNGHPPIICTIANDILPSIQVWCHIETKAGAATCPQSFICINYGPLNIEMRHFPLLARFIGPFISLRGNTDNTIQTSCQQTPLKHLNVHQNRENSPQIYIAYSKWAQVRMLTLLCRVPYG